MMDGPTQYYRPQPDHLAHKQRRRSSLTTNPNDSYRDNVRSATASASSNLLPLAAHGPSHRSSYHTNLRASYPMALSSQSYSHMEDPRPTRRPPSLVSPRSSASFESRRRSTSTLSTQSTAPTSRLSSDSVSSSKRPVSLWSRNSTFEKQKGSYYRLPNRPGDGWRKLPEEVLVLILSMLRESHLQPGSNSCATCYMRDMTSLAISCKKWMNVSQPFLYDRIYFNGPHISLQHKKNKPKHNTRLKLLRRTLRASPHLARCVTELKPPQFFAVKGTAEEQEHYLDTVASLVMACPNLERLVDFYPMYNNEFSRLFHALFSRRNLASHAWIIGPTLHQQQFSRRTSIVADMTPPPTPPFQHSLQLNDFMISHSNWENLTTLLLHSTTPHTTIKPSIIASYLPSLENLHISSFPASCFSTDDLTNLRPLKSLTLSSLPGISSYSLSKYCTLPNAAPLHTLTLLNLSLDSLAVIARLLSFLHNLRRFTVQQTYAPTLTAADSIVLHPYLASRTLTHLHWDILYPEPPNTITTTQIFAASIATSGFPSLRTIRAPEDTDGHLQQLCRPKDNVLKPRDTILNLTSNPSATDLRDKDFKPRLEDTPRTSGDGRSWDAFPSRDLSRARVAAQERIERARGVPKFVVVVEDYSGGPRGNLRARFGLGAYMGTVGSCIQYVLHADGPDERNGGLVGIGALSVIPSVEAESGKEGRDSKERGSRRGSRDESTLMKEAVAKEREREGTKERGCEGAWNREHKKGKKWWGHVEREREGKTLAFEKLFV